MDCIMELMDMLLHRRSIRKYTDEAIPEEKLEKIVGEVFDLRPNAIIRALDLRRPIYRQTAAYGHFGRDDLNLPWEALNKVEALKAAAK